MKISITLVFMALSVPLAAQAAMIPITPLTELRLGDGVEPVTEQHFNSCVEYDPNDVYAEDDGKGDFSARKAELSLELVTSYQDFDRYTNTQISGSVKALSGGGSFSYNAESKYTMHSDQAALGILSHADYGRWYIRNVKLKPEMAKLAKENPKKFHSICGSEYVAGYVLGQGIKVLLSTSENSVYSYEKIQASLSASYNGGAYSGEMSAAFTNVTTELIKNGMLKIHYLSYGAGEMKAHEALIRDQKDIAGYREEIANILSKIEGKKAVRITYITRPYPGVQTAYDPILTEHQKQTIWLLFSNYRRLWDTRARLSNIMGPDFEKFADTQCVQDYKQYCVDYVKAVEKSRDFVEKSIALISTLAKQCIKAEEVTGCRLPTSEEVNMDVLNRVRWPNQFKYAMYIQMLKDIRDREKNQEKKP